MEMKDLIQRIAEALVDRPEQVTVTALVGSQATVLELPKRIWARSSANKGERPRRFAPFWALHRPKNTNGPSLKLLSSLVLIFMFQGTAQTP